MEKFFLKLAPLPLSIIVHLLLIIFLFFSALKLKAKKINYLVPIEESIPNQIQDLKPKEESPQVVLKSINQNPQQTNTPTRQVFGLSRQSLTGAKESGQIEVKKGNTITKEQDHNILRQEDADSLPTPTESYLVSEMPSVLIEAKPDYPQEAREKQIEGAVTLDILIDQQGIVRDARIIEGEEVFRTVALESIKKFKFRPATMNEQKVAVRIRYLLRFKLDY